MADVLAGIAAGEMVTAVEQLEALKGAPDNNEIVLRAKVAADTESEIASLLKRLLADPSALMTERLEQQGQKEEVSEEVESLESSREMVERMLDNVRMFQNEQREAIELSNSLAELPVENFTAEDEKILGEVIDTEEKWARYFQEAATDLSKLPPQDHSLAGLSKEFLEIYSELAKASEALKAKKIELAVPAEQGGLELAESIETNLEKWLMETPDHEQWKMEDAEQDFDMPLAELPDELEDLIGDLKDQEEDMAEDIEDATSGWMDSLDKGAGWGAQDGPISNMSAKGSTGNRLPNIQEIGGRSGEGRTGKSGGQFVEETASGKGGRKTPTRLTPDPFEAGSVEDTSAEAPTGSTGGGKLSGQGQEGLQGPIPPAIQSKLKRVASLQQQLIDRAKRIDHTLQRYRYPRGKLPSTIEIMEEIEQNLVAGELSTFGRKQRIVLDNLREVKTLVTRQKELIRDTGRALPKKLLEEIAAARKESVPEQYKEMVRGYFKALSAAE